MPYVATIPQAADRIKDSQPLILGNFTAIPTLLTVNHYGFADPNEGKHQYVSLPEQGASPATAVNEAAIFSRQGAYSAVSELCFRRENSGAVYEMTSATFASPGWTFLPSGILLKWGNSTANGLTTITFPAGAGIPAFTEILSIQITTSYVNVADGDGFVRLNNFLAPWTQFTVYGSRRVAVADKAVSFQFLAIGY